MSPEEFAAKRAARKAAANTAAAEQKSKDLEALDAAEVKYGDGATSSIEVPYRPGLPMLVVVRGPSKMALKRYRSRVKIKDGSIDPAANAEASEELAPTCVEYPDAETFTAMCEAFPGLAAQSGVAALQLASGKAAEEGKG